ncbi:MAG: FMN-binding protein [Tenuifilaceae bacterium]
MKRSTIILSIFFTIHTCLFAQTSMDFYPKKLENELEKSCGKNFLIKELITPANVSGQIFLGKFYSVSANASEPSAKYIYIGRVNTCRMGGCSISTGQSTEKASEFFDYFILFDSTITVQQVKIYNYQATHGQEVTAKGWLKQFIGYMGDFVLTPGKNIDAISGATISVDATAFDIEHKTGLLKQTLKK